MGVQTCKSYDLEPGTHTFHLLGRINSGTGSVNTNYFTISIHIFEDGVVINGGHPPGDNIPFGRKDGTR
jgi:hypothetical protein